MAADRLGGSGWNNSYMAVVSKTEYYWNEEAGKVTNDTTALKVSQKIGIAAMLSLVRPFFSCEDRYCFTGEEGPY